MTEDMVLLFDDENASINSYSDVVFAAHKTRAMFMLSGTTGVTADIEVAPTESGPWFKVASLTLSAPLFQTVELLPYVRAKRTDVVADVNDKLTVHMYATSAESFFV